MRTGILMVCIGIWGGLLAVAADPEKKSEADLTKSEKLAAQIKDLAGDAVVDETKPDKPIIKVDLSSTEMTDKLFEQLTSGLTSLEELKVSETKLTDAAFKKLKSFSKLKVLDMSGTGITTATTKQFKELPDLEELNLSRTKIGDPALDAIKSLKNLRKLDLSDTKVTDVGLKHLKEATELQALNLHGRKAVTDKGLEHLKELTKMKVLDLSDTKITEAGLLASLSEMKDLEKLNVEGLKVSEFAEKKLKKIASKVVITK